MLEFLKKFLRLKTLDLEAKLRPTTDCTFGGVGEVEVESYSDGSATIELSLKHSGAPPGSSFDVFCGGRRWGALPVSGGYAKQVLDIAAGEPVPPVAAGDPAEFRQGDVVLYRGTFRRD